MSIARRALWSAVVVSLALSVWTGSAPAQETVSLRAEKVRNAIAEIKGRAAEAPGDIEVLIELGNLYYENNMYDQALATYLEVVEVDSTHVGGRLNLGSVYVDLQRFEEAERHFLAAARLDPENGMVYTNLGTAYYTSQRFSEAMEMFRRALELDPDNVEAHFNFGVAFADAYLFGEAIREWERVIELAPESPVAGLCRENVAMLEEYRSSQ